MDRQSTTSDNKHVIRASGDSNEYSEENNKKETRDQIVKRDPGMKRNWI